MVRRGMSALLSDEPDDLVDLTDGIPDEPRPEIPDGTRTAPATATTGPTEADFDSFLTEMMQSMKSKQSAKAADASSMTNSASTESSRSETRPLQQRPRRGIIAPGDDLPFFGGVSLQGGAASRAGPAGDNSTPPGIPSAPSLKQADAAARVNVPINAPQAPDPTHYTSTASADLSAPSYSRSSAPKSFSSSAPMQNIPPASRMGAPAPFVDASSTHFPSASVAPSIPAPYPSIFSPIPSAYSVPDSSPSADDAAPMCKSPPAVIIIDMCGEATAEPAPRATASAAAPSSFAGYNPKPSTTPAQGETDYDGIPDWARSSTASGAGSKKSNRDPGAPPPPRAPAAAPTPSTSTSGSKRYRDASASTKDSEPEVITLDSDSEDTDPDIKPPLKPQPKRAKRSVREDVRALYEEAEVEHNRGMHARSYAAGSHIPRRRSIPVLVPSQEEQRQQQQQYQRQQQQYHHGYGGGPRAFDMHASASVPAAHSQAQGQGQGRQPPRQFGPTGQPFNTEPRHANPSAYFRTFANEQQARYPTYAYPPGFHTYAVPGAAFNFNGMFHPMPRFASAFEQERLFREAANAFKAAAPVFASSYQHQQGRAYADEELTVETAIRMASSRYSGHHETLGLSRTASSGEIRKRYLLLAKLLHPDKSAQRSGGADVARAAEEAFKEVSKAYQTLR